MTHYQNVVFCLLFVVLVAGCSGKVKVRGTVVFDDDQSPLTVGSVLLQNDTHSAKGKIDATGSFRISSVKPNDGVPPGVYHVAVLGAIKLPESTVQVDASLGALEAAAAMRSAPSPEPIPLIHPKFMDPKTSGILFDTSKDKVLNIRVERAGK